MQFGTASTVMGYLYCICSSLWGGSWARRKSSWDRSICGLNLTYSHEGWVVAKRIILQKQADVLLMVARLRWFPQTSEVCSDKTCCSFVWKWAVEVVRPSDWDASRLSHCGGTEGIIHLILPENTTGSPEMNRKVLLWLDLYALSRLIWTSAWISRRKLMDWHSL